MRLLAVAALALLVALGLQATPAAAATRAHTASTHTSSTTTTSTTSTTTSTSAETPIPVALSNVPPAAHRLSSEKVLAIANRLPVLNLTAQGGTQANYFSDMFASGNGFWTIAASVTQPVFDGGTLLHKARAAWAALDQARAQYRGTTLAAFQNVADTLAALQADADGFAAASTAEKSASEALRIVRLQVSLGQVAYLSILNAQQTALQTELALIQARGSRLADSAALFQALGGGWWHRDDVQVTDIRGNDPSAVIGVH